MSQGVAVTTASISVWAPHKLAFVDLTDQLQRAVADSEIADGFCVAFCRHTTCGLMINEWEEGAQQDLLKRLDVLVPDGIYYAHDDLGVRTQNLVEDERANGRAHVLQMIVGGNSQVVPVAAGIPLLGRWQRLFLLELDEPKERTILFQTIGARAALEPSDLPRLERCGLTPSP